MTIINRDDFFVVFMIRKHCEEMNDTRMKASNEPPANEKGKKCASWSSSKKGNTEKRKWTTSFSIFLFPGFRYAKFVS